MSEPALSREPSARTSVAALGASHRLLKVTELNALRNVGAVVDEVLARSPSLAGHVLLSTCNRFELYVEAVSPQDALREALAVMRDALAPELRRVVDDVEVYDEQGAAQHLFEVASGLQSMVVGENEVLGQVRAALVSASPHVGPALHRLFDDALSTGKTVSSTTGLSTAGRSLAGVGLDLVASRHFELAGRRSLLVGTGSFARVVTAALLKRDCTDISVFSSSGRAEGFAATHPVTPIPVSGLDDALAVADLVVLCSGQRRDTPPLTAARLGRARRATDGLLPVLDLSLRGDQAPDVADVPWVDLIDLDEIAANAPAGPQDAVLAAREVVAQRVDAFLAAESGRSSAPLVAAMRDHVSAYIRREMQIAARRCDPATAAAVERSLRRVSNSLLHTPSVRAADFARQGSLDQYSAAVATVFGIEVGR